ncbi:MAG: hypothetical protein ACTSRZ_15445 [Promethearchaeota archaeon]
MKDYSNQTTYAQKKYLIFKCIGCQQWTYAKITQKMKKCPRCGINYYIDKIFKNMQKYNAYTVNGLTQANKEIRRLQSSISLAKTKSFSSNTPTISLNKASFRFQPATQQINRQKSKNHPIIQIQSYIEKNESNIQKKSNNFNKTNKNTDLILKLFDFIYNMQKEENIDPNEGFPEYIIEIAMEELNIPIEKRNDLIYKFKAHSKSIQVSENQWFLT